MNNKFTEESITYFFNERNNIRKEYDNKISNISNKFFKDNNIPFKVGDRVMLATGKVGTIISLYTEPYKHIRYCNYIPMVRVKLTKIWI